MLEDDLLSIGLTRSEAKVYVALLRLGPSLAGGIAKELPVNRTNIYDALKRLADKGLVAYAIRSGRKHFHAVEPKMLLRYLEERQQRIEGEKARVRSLLPELEALRPTAEGESVEIYEGKEGIKNVLEDILKTRATVYTYGTEDNFSGLLRFYFRHYLDRFGKLGVRMHVVFTRTPGQKPFGWKFAKVRYLPPAYASPTETTVYGNKVAIFVFTGSPRVVLICSPSVAKAYRKYFDVLWKAARPWAPER